MSSLQSISNNTISEDIYFEISRFSLPGYSPFLVFGENLNVSTTLETLWSESGLYTYPTIAENMTVSSASTDDTSNGDGARSVRIAGLDTNYEWQHEDVILNGVNGVLTTKKFLRINRFKVLTSGDNATSTGPIYIGTGTITAGKPAIVYGKINGANDRDNIALQSPFTIPAGYCGIIKGLLVNTGKGKEAKVGLTVRPQGLTAYNVGKVFSFESSLFISFDLPPRVPEKADLELRAREIVSEGITVLGGYTIVLEKGSADYFINPTTWERVNTWVGVKS